MARKKGSNGERLDRHDKDILKLQEEMNKSKDNFEQHVEYHVKHDLQIPRFPGSNKFLYTYDEIAENYHIPKSKVQKIAELNNLTRRNLKRIK